jgi:hypothetical protein
MVIQLCFLRNAVQHNELIEQVVSATETKFDDAFLTNLLRGTATSQGSFGLATKAVKTFFADLGRQLDYRVATSGVAAERGEWLYDLVWYHGSDTWYRRQGLVLETEMRPGASVKNASHVDVDFHKLIQARADIRVWLGAIPNTSMVDEHMKNCERQIAEFEQSIRGDFYMFILFDWSINKTVVQTYEYT